MDSRISCRTTKSLITYVSSRGLDVSALLEQCPFSQDYLTHVYHWVPEDIVLELVERAARLLDEEDLAYQVGASSLTRPVLGGAYVVACLMGSPRRVYENISKFPPYFDERAEITIPATRRNSAVIIMRHPMRHPDSRYICPYVRGMIASVPTLWKLPPAAICEKQCIVPVHRAGTLKGKSYRVDPEGTVLESDDVLPSKQEQAIGKLRSDGTFEVNGVAYGASACVYEVSWVERLPWYKRLRVLMNKGISLLGDRWNLREEAIQEVERDKCLIQKMHELEQFKSEFLLTFAHELEEPLTSLKSSASLLSEAVKDLPRPSLGKLAKIMGRNAEKIDEMLSRLRHIANLQASELEISPAPYDVAHPIVTAVTQMTPLVESKGQHIEVEALPTGAMTTMPLDRFNLILDNLLSNAHRFTPEQGRISIALRKGGNRFTVEVSDTGIGIPEEEQERIFDMFYRSRRVRMDGIAGNGLGLSLVKQLLEMYGGIIWVTSTVGKGSTFYFSLPMVTD